MAKMVLIHVLWLNDDYQFSISIAISHTHTSSHSTISFHSTTTSPHSIHNSYHSTHSGLYSTHRFSFTYWSLFHEHWSPFHTYIHTHTQRMTGSRHILLPWPRRGFPQGHYIVMMSQLKPGPFCATDLPKKCPQKRYITYSIIRTCTYVYTMYVYIQIHVHVHNNMYAHVCRVFEYGNMQFYHPQLW